MEKLEPHTLLLVQMLWKINSMVIPQVNKQTGVHQMTTAVLFTIAKK
jgi:hypothetical protein